MPRASIDIGSNSLLLLVLADDGQVLHDEARVVGLGRGLKDRGVFRPDRMEIALATLRDYAAKAGDIGVTAIQIKAVATSASRRALNAATFYQQVYKQSGIRVEIVAGEEEARLTWLGSIQGLELAPGPVMVVDPGGGSTEIILGEGKQIRERTSLEIGTVRLTEQFLAPEGGLAGGSVAGAMYEIASVTAFGRMRDAVEAAFATAPMPTLPRNLVAVAGTATTLAACELGLTEYDGAKVHGFQLTISAVRRWIDLLLEAGPVRRRELVVASPERADTMLAGALILQAAMTKARRQSCRVSDRGLRYGVLEQRSA